MRSRPAAAGPRRSVLEHHQADADAGGQPVQQHAVPATDLAALLEKAGFSQIESREYGMPLGYLLETARNAVGKRKLAAAPEASMEQRTGASARLLQPKGLLYGGVARYGTAPFRYLQRGFPRVGTGLVVRARLAA